MSKTSAVLALALALAVSGCSRRVDLVKVPVGTHVQITRQDGGVVQGTLTARDDSAVKVASGAVTRSIPVDQIADVQVLAEEPAPVPAIAKFREIMVPEGTQLGVRLESAVGSDSSHVGDPVEATLTEAVIADGIEALPPGSIVRGEVVAVRAPGRIRGRARLALRFDSVSVAGRDQACPISARASWVAPATKGKDAATVALPAAGGAIVGALFGGKKGAAVGAAIGGAGGAVVALSTAGPQVRLERGAVMALRLDHAVDVRVPITQR